MYTYSIYTYSRISSSKSWCGKYEDVMSYLAGLMQKRIPEVVLPCEVKPFMGGIGFLQLQHGREGRGNVSIDQLLHN